MLKAQDCCLAVIDVQCKLADMMYEQQRLCNNIEVLIKSAKLLGIEILWVQQVPRVLGATVDSIAELLEGNKPINKNTFSCLKDEVFRQKLNEVNKKHVIVCGIEAHICVYQTAMDLLENARQVTVVSDAVSSRTLENKQIAIARLENEGVKISSVEMLLFEMLGNAKHPNFREIAKLIK